MNNGIGAKDNPLKIPYRPSLQAYVIKPKRCYKEMLVYNRGRKSDKFVKKKPAYTAGFFNFLLFYLIDLDIFTSGAILASALWEGVGVNRQLPVALS